MQDLKENVSPQKESGKSIVSIRAVLNHLKKLFLPWVIISVVFKSITNTSFVVKYYHIQATFSMLKIWLILQNGETTSIVKVMDYNCL